VENEISLLNGFDKEKFIEACAKIAETIQPFIDAAVKAWNEFCRAVADVWKSIKPPFKRYAWAALIEYRRVERAQTALPRKRTIKPYHCRD
jgi:hypothetical protein